MKVVNLGEISGNVVLNLTATPPYFVGTLVGHCTFTFKRRTTGAFVLDLTQGGAGSYNIAFNGAGGKTVIDPSDGVLIQQFFVGANGVGARSIGMWADARLFVSALGFNATSPP